LIYYMYIDWRLTFILSYERRSSHSNHDWCRYILLRAAVVFLFWFYIFRTSCDAFGDDTLSIMNLFFGVVVDMLFCWDCIYLRHHMRPY
jgi:hypothetical protein